jgi:biopolymer transport protein ExbD
MPARFYERRERREPEKTPLIDVIFLLLIFFFVTVVGLDVSHKPTRGARSSGTQKKLDLLPMINPPETAPAELSEVVLIQVQPGNALNASQIGELNVLIEQANSLPGKPFGAHPRISPENFLILVFDEKYADIDVIPKFIGDLREALKVYRAEAPDTLEVKIRQLMDQYLPINMPKRGADDFSTLYERSINTLRERVRHYFQNRREREIHIRMDKEVYVRFIDDLYKICNEQNIDVEHLKFRVLEQRITS